MVLRLYLDAAVHAAVQTMPQALERHEQTQVAHALLPREGISSMADIKLNISHSGAWLAAAWSPQAAIGVDIEAIRPMQWLGDDAVLAAVLHPDEIKWLNAGTPAQRVQRGLMSWCRKEALLKAMGLGLASGFPLAGIGHSPDGSLHILPASLERMCDAGRANDWHTHSDWIDDEEHGRQAALAVAWRRVEDAAT